MKAEEVRRRYASGDKNFQNANLRGQNFKGQDLSGADFSNADIRSANFSQANLTDADFTGAKAGLQKRWVILQLLIAIPLSAVINFVAVVLSAVFATALLTPSSIEQYTIFPGSLLLLTIAIAVSAIARQGFTTRALITIAAVVTVVSSVVGAFTFALKVIGPFTVISSVAGASAVASAGVAAVTLTSAVAVAAVGAVTLILTNLVVIAFAVIGAGVAAGAVAVAGVVGFAVAVLALSFYVAWQALKGDEKFALVRSFGVAFGALGGTRFYQANLTGANFINALLKSANFREANLTHVCWKEAQKLDRSRVGESILADPKVQKLLVTRSGYKQTYIGANLEGANLQGIDLTEANLTRANLSNANLERAELKQANLKETLATGTNFTHAHLTAACLEAWNIDSTTILDNVDCQYVFLLEKPDAKGRRERRPHDPDAVFQPGDFEKLYKKMINVVQILLRNGINREAFAEAFQNLMDEHAEIDYASIQGIERKGDDVLVTLEVPETADKAKISQAFLQPYESRVKQLEAKTEQLQLHAADLKDIAIALAQKPIVNQAVAQGTAMQETNDSSQTIHVGRDMNLTGSTLNLGEISGNVTNTINQLPDEPATTDQPSLKDLLTQLQQAITTDTDLEETDKADLLEQVQALATVKQTEEPAQKEGIVRKSKKIFEATLKSLPDTAKIVEACSKLLPLILKALGIPV